MEKKYELETNIGCELKQAMKSFDPLLKQIDSINDEDIVSLKSIKHYESQLYLWGQLLTLPKRDVLIEKFKNESKKSISINEDFYDLSVEDLMRLNEFVTEGKALEESDFSPSENLENRLTMPDSNYDQYVLFLKILQDKNKKYHNLLIDPQSITSKNIIKDCELHITNEVITGDSLKRVFISYFKTVSLGVRILQLACSTKGYSEIIKVRNHFHIDQLLSVNRGIVQVGCSYPELVDQTSILPSKTQLKRFEKETEKRRQYIKNIPV